MFRRCFETGGNASHCRKQALPAGGRRVSKLLYYGVFSTWDYGFSAEEIMPTLLFSLPIRRGGKLSVLPSPPQPSPTDLVAVLPRLYRNQKVIKELHGFNFPWDAALSRHSSHGYNTNISDLYSMEHDWYSSEHKRLSEILDLHLRRSRAVSAAKKRSS